MIEKEVVTKDEIVEGKKKRFENKEILDMHLVWETIDKQDEGDESKTSVKESCSKETPACSSVEHNLSQKSKSNEDESEEEDELIMMLCCNQNEYMIFQESNTEESTLLRCVSGGHNEEITVMAYDFHLSLVATGCVNGEITLYDFEMSKILGIL